MCRLLTNKYSFCKLLFWFTIAPNNYNLQQSRHRNPPTRPAHRLFLCRLRWSSHVPHGHGLGRPADPRTATLREAENLSMENSHSWVISRRVFPGGDPQPRPTGRKVGAHGVDAAATAGFLFRNFGAKRFCESAWESSALPLVQRGSTFSITP